MKFFIGYSRSTKDIVRDVVESLRDSNADVWWDEDLRAGQNSWALILDKIEACNIFIFIVSERSVQSPVCLAELRYALARNRLVLPYIVDTLTYPLPAEISRIHCEPYSSAKHFISRLRVTCREIDWAQYRDRYATRPSEPSTSQEDLVAQLDHAISMAHAGQCDEAIGLFDAVLRSAYQDYGSFCHDWIEKLQLYHKIASLAHYSETQSLAWPEWEHFLQMYGSDFDPFGISQKLTIVDADDTQPSRPASFTNMVARHTRATSHFDIYDAIEQFHTACDEQDWETAAALLEVMRESGVGIPCVFNLEAYEQEIQMRLDEAIRDKDYDIIRRMLKRKEPNYRLIREALENFWSRFPDYDPDGLKESKELFAHVWFTSADDLASDDYVGRLAAYSEAILLKPDFCEAYVRRGNIHHATKAYNAAIDDFTQAIRLNPYTTEAYYGRGYSSAALNRHPLALADFKQVLSLDPRHRHGNRVRDLIEILSEGRLQTQA
jgi:tetratricopeptide (TPR) repeat protein